MPFLSDRKLLFLLQLIINPDYQAREQIPGAIEAPHIYIRTVAKLERINKIKNIKNFLQSSKNSFQFHNLIFSL
jgi:hypothetical protein